ncbi:MAG: hypothetical protein M3416_02740 [Acidobacteriota bacterium]|nr:hypothetical protein [Acidobacteriota bacterium]
MEESEAAGQLLTFARTEFGEHLCALLLAGYGEDEVRRRRTFVVTPRAGAGRERQVILATDDPSGLPRGQDPLVLLALLKSLWLSGRVSTAGVSYTPRALMRTLGRVESGTSRAAVERAVERYFNLSVAAEDVLETGAGARPLSLTRMHRLVISYDHEEESGADDRRHGRAQSRLRFNPDLIEALRARSLLGIEWDLVGSVAQTP